MSECSEFRFKNSLKAIFECSLSEVKLPSGMTCKAYFGMKMNEIWRHDYRSEIASNDVFHFSANIKDLIRISVDELSHV